MRSADLTSKIIFMPLAEHHLTTDPSVGIVEDSLLKRNQKFVKEIKEYLKRDQFHQPILQLQILQNLPVCFGNHQVQSGSSSWKLLFFFRIAVTLTSCIVVHQDWNAVLRHQNIKLHQHAAVLFSLKASF